MTVPYGGPRAYAGRMGIMRWAATPGATAAGGALGDLVEIFQPSAHFLTEEKERRRLDIAQTPSADPGTGEIDLDGGSVTITLPPG